jgi:hypothetical protein
MDNRYTLIQRPNYRWDVVYNDTQHITGPLGAKDFDTAIKAIRNHQEVLGNEI